jgi:hypothetical protein
MTTRSTIIARALQLQRTCGTFATARYLARRGVPIAVVLFVLTGRVI